MVSTEATVDVGREILGWREGLPSNSQGHLQVRSAPLLWVMILFADESQWRPVSFPQLFASTEVEQD